MADNNLSKCKSFNVSVRKTPSNYLKSFLTTMDEVSFSWRNITVSTPTSWRKKTAQVILDRSSGFLNKGELMAVMGPSAAGKSTLMHALTFQNTGNLKIEGERFANGIQMTPSAMTGLSGFIPQVDFFIGTLTVREHLTFLSNLKLPSSLTKTEKRDRVDAMMDELGLRKCADTLIGVRGRVKGISGGEMRRLSFASAALADPPIMFCDEPTSGLDSWMTENIVDLMRSMTRRGRTIICVIHQPGSEVFHKFDRLLLISKGRTAFQGTIDEAQKHFDTIGFPCPLDFNPADHYIHKLSMTPKHENEYIDRVNYICDKYEKSEYFEKVTETVKNHADNGVELFGNIDFDLSTIPLYRASWWSQFRALLWRSWNTILKEPLVTKIRVAQAVILALFVGAIFFGQETDQEHIQNINGALFWVCLNQAFLNYSGVLVVFCNEIPTFLREHHDGMYRVDTYFLTKQLADMPVFLLIPVLFMAIFYYMVNFNSGVDHYFMAILITILIVQAAVGMGILMSCVSPNFTVALALGPTIMVPLLNLGGFYQRGDSFPAWMAWMKYISLWYYGNEAFNINQWSDIDYIPCDSTEPEKCLPLSSGDEVLAFFDFHEKNLVRDLLLLIALSVGFRFMGFLSLLLKAKR